MGRRQFRSFLLRRGFLNKDNIPKREEIPYLRDEGIRRALNTPPKHHNKLVGKTERAQDMKIMRHSKTSKKYND